MKPEFFCAGWLAQPARATARAATPSLVKVLKVMAKLLVQVVVVELRKSSHPSILPDEIGTQEIDIGVIGADEIAPPAGQRAEALLVHVLVAAIQVLRSQAPFEILAGVILQARPEAPRLVGGEGRGNVVAVLVIGIAARAENGQERAGRDRERYPAERDHG